MSFLFGFLGGIGNVIIPHSAPNEMSFIESIQYIVLTFLIVFFAGILGLKVSREGGFLRRILLTTGRCLTRLV